MLNVVSFFSWRGKRLIWNWFRFARLDNSSKTIIFSTLKCSTVAQSTEMKVHAITDIHMHAHTHIIFIRILLHTYISMYMNWSDSKNHPRLVFKTYSWSWLPDYTEMKTFLPTPSSGKLHQWSSSSQSFPSSSSCVEEHLFCTRQHWKHVGSCFGFCRVL